MKDPMKIYSENKEKRSESPEECWNLEFEGNMKILKKKKKTKEDSQRYLRGDRESRGQWKRRHHKGVVIHVPPCRDVKKAKGRDIVGQVTNLLGLSRSISFFLVETRLEKFEA